MFGLFLAISAVALTIAGGIYHWNSQSKRATAIFKYFLTFSAVLLFSGMIFTPASLFAETTSQSQQVNGSAMIGVALSTGLASLGAGIAVAFTGSAAIGAISENPRMLGRSLIFVGLAEGIAIYGLIISIMIFGRV